MFIPLKLIEIKHFKENNDFNSYSNISILSVYLILTSYKSKQLISRCSIRENVFIPLIKSVNYRILIFVDETSNFFNCGELDSNKLN